MELRVKWNCRALPRMNNHEKLKRWRLEGSWLLTQQLMFDKKKTLLTYLFPLAGCVGHQLVKDVSHLL